MKRIIVCLIKHEVSVMWPYVTLVCARIIIYVLLFGISTTGQTGFKHYVGNGTIGVYPIQANPVSVAVMDTRANVTCGIPIVDAEQNYLPASSRWEC